MGIPVTPITIEVKYSWRTRKPSHNFSVNLLYTTKVGRRRRRSSFNCQYSSNSSASLLPPPSPIGSFAASPRKDPESRPSLAVKSSIVTHASASLLHPSSPLLPFLPFACQTLRPPLRSTWVCVFKLLSCGVDCCRLSRHVRSACDFDHTF
ncbi:hypothetical protein ASPVEDRAFT_679906 [Aspergillus versicolor CBS 583.65]|uniref:Uncharacterized protein n=1 Tax=Aspergillus versicolor CBS 583.65 TaxID=1036611 RepID=A0A1L9PLZ4_ASPVE|nr:uncharacterized protein ASPVEDRAFT_679906 [Aspergillus versicolor CBS 583.65]OJJ02538.1 hypothetical protein ASPVEDRAFT_679906 [Aspergillus versicolor CBS 583.65]